MSSGRFEGILRVSRGLACLLQDSRQDPSGLLEYRRVFPRDRGRVRSNRQRQGACVGKEDVGGGTRDDDGRGGGEVERETLNINDDGLWCATRGFVAVGNLSHAAISLFVFLTP